MYLRSSAPVLLLLLSLCLLGSALEVKGQEWGYLREALKASDLLSWMDNQPQLERNKTGVLITTLLRAVHCAERTGTSQDICDKVSSTLLFSLYDAELLHPACYQLIIDSTAVCTFHEMCLLWLECE